MEELIFKIIILALIVIIYYGYNKNRKRKLEHSALIKNKNTFCPHKNNI